MIDNIWIDEQAAPGISEFDFSKDSLKETLEEYYRMPLHYVQQILELERCEAEFSQLLEVPEGQQLLAATRAVYTSRSETPFMVALCHFRADLFRFHVEVDLSDRGSR
jgi:DNA-binding GntR family transcriptional regulator